MSNHRPRIFLLILTMAGLVLSGCEKLGLDKLLGKDGSGSGDTNVQVVQAFAVIDLDEVARRLGRDVALQQALQQRQAQLNQEVNQLRNNYQRQVAERREILGEEVDEGQQRELAQLVEAMNVQLNRAAGTAQRQLSQDQLSLVEQFRNEVRPVAVEIAAERGLNTIMTRNDSILFAYDSRFDITEEVIRRMGTPMVP